MSQQDQHPGNGFGLESKADGKRHPVTESISLGRDPGSDVVLSSGKASRKHARVFIEGDRLWVEDLNSTNGTFVNGQKLSGKAALENGDSVRFGDLIFTAIAPASADAGGEATMLASGQTVLHSAAEAPAPAEPEVKKAPPAEEKKAPPQKEAKPEKAAQQRPGEKKPAREKPAAKEADDKPQEKAAKPAKESKPAADEPARKEPKQERPAAKEGPAVAAPHEGNPSIPASWADAEELEQASHTAFVSRAPRTPSEGDAAGALKAIAQARKEVPASEPILVGLTEPIRGKVIRLQRKQDVDKWEMGRNESADIVLENESVSGRHAQLVCEQGRWKVVNMMSVNGTFVNGRKVLSAYLNPKDRIRMGTVELVFDAPVGKGGRAASTGSRAASDRQPPAGIGQKLREGIQWLKSRLGLGS